MHRAEKRGKPKDRTREEKTPPRSWKNSFKKQGNRIMERVFPEGRIEEKGRAPCFFPRKRESPLHRPWKAVMASNYKVTLGKEGGEGKKGKRRRVGRSRRRKKR